MLLYWPVIRVCDLSSSFNALLIIISYHRPKVESADSPIASLMWEEGKLEDNEIINTSSERLLLGECKLRTVYVLLRFENP